MPRAPKQCANPNCTTRVTARTYCDKHQPMNWQGDPRTGTKQHKQWRQQVLNRDNHQCQIRGPQCQGQATIADHIIPVKFGGQEHDPNNGQAVCAPCHKTKTATEAAQARARR